jgi:hypothetical protein
LLFGSTERHFLFPGEKAMPSLETRYRQTLKWLRKEFPAILDVRLAAKVRDDEGNDCCATHNSGTAPRQIRISKESPWEARIDSLLHEWAHEHALLGKRCSDACDVHCDHWGKWYSRIYRAWCHWNYGDEA